MWSVLVDFSYEFRNLCPLRVAPSIVQGGNITIRLLILGLSDSVNNGMWEVERDTDAHSDDCPQSQWDDPDGSRALSHLVHR